MKRDQIKKDLEQAKTLGIESKESGYTLHRTALDKLIIGFVTFVRGEESVRRTEKERLYALLESTRKDCPENFPNLFDEIAQLCSSDSVAA